MTMIRNRPAGINNGAATRQSVLCHYFSTDSSVGNDVQEEG